MKLIPFYIIITFGFLIFLTSCQGNGAVNPNEPTKPLEQPNRTANPDNGEKLKTSNSNGTIKVGIEEDYINTNRVIWQKPDMVIQLLGNIQNRTIADIGAGTGFFALRLVPQAKKVIALDIDPQFVDYLDSIKILELPENLQDKLETRLAKPNDPQLRDGEADIVVIVNTFMYIQNRTNYLRTLKQGISEGGKLLIIDFKKKRTPIGPPSDIRIPLFLAEEELYKAGYRNVQTNDTALDYQYIIIAGT